MNTLLIISFYYFLTRFYLFEKIYKFRFSKYNISVTKSWVRMSYVPIYGEILASVAIVAPPLNRLLEIIFNFFWVEDEEEF